jgi:hypothetical protein
MELEYLIYWVGLIFAIVLVKLKMKRWWKITNSVIFVGYYSYNMYLIITNQYHDDGFIVSLLTTFLMLIHLAFLVVVFFISKAKIENHSS